MKNWNFVQVSDRELKEFTDFGTPVEIPHGMAPLNGGVILVGEDGNQQLAFNDPIEGAKPLTTHNPIKGMKPKNKDLHLLYEQLQNPNVRIVMMDGLFGTGKTSTVMAHACQNFYDDGFKMVITKPHVPVGRSNGHLPGTLEEKVDPELSSFYQYIERFQQRPLEVLKMAGQIEIAPFEYVRGRDYPNSWLVVDESQNLSKKEAITIATRLADGDEKSTDSKLILLGDTSEWQKDTKHKEDGLTFLYELLKDEGIVGKVEMKTEQHVIRGKIAKALARNLLKLSTPS